MKIINHISTPPESFMLTQQNIYEIVSSFLREESDKQDEQQSGAVS